MVENLVSYKYLIEQNITFNIIQLEREPRSAADIVELFKCPLEEVVKTLLFVNKNNEYAIVSLPGDKKVDTDKLAQHLDWSGKVRMASKDETLAVTKLHFGGITPFFNVENYNVQFYLDPLVLTYEKINIGSGEPRIGFEMAPADLEKIWPGKIADISVGEQPTIRLSK